MGGGNFKISWRTDSYASIEQYRLLYRKSPVRKLVEVFVMINISRENISVGGQQSQLRLDQRGDTGASAHSPTQI